MNVINDQPILLLDKKRCLKNIDRMVNKADKHQLNLRPHFKTHQSREVGRWFRERGVEGITVSSLKMAQYFANDGWDSITIAFPVNINSLEAINELAGKIKLTILVDHLDSAEKFTSSITEQVDVLIELDAGSNRSGVNVDHEDHVRSIIQSLKNSKNINWKGFYSHFGHTYSCRGKQEVLDVFSKSLEKINSLIRKNGWNEKELHIGDTPGCSLADSFPGVTTITAGNFVFYDLMQLQIGACSEEDLAILMVCPVVSIKETRQEIVIHGGAVHFSKEAIKVDGNNAYGLQSDFGKAGIKGLIKENSIRAVSQEHGIVSFKDHEAIKTIQLGDLIGVAPVHSCLTAEAMGDYLDFEGNQIDHL